MRSTSLSPIKSIALFVTALLVASFSSYAQNNVTVNVANVLNDVSTKPVGINMDYLMDGSYVVPTATTTTALQGTGVKLLRYPGGEKSDNYLWSSPPWSSAQPKFARTGSCEWPSGDTRFAQTDWTTPKSNVLDFDEFMTMCQAVGGEPLIVVAYDGMYKPASCGTIPTKAQLLANAEEWVRYANIVKGYHIKYWMIGNESYKTDSYNGHATPAQYRDDVIEFSQHMKAIDPTIKIIANGDGNAWWSTVLPTAAAHIDYIGLSNYPCYNFSGGYTYYKSNTPDFMGVVNNTINAINSYAPVSERSRLKVITTEFNSNDWSGAWPDANDMGHALAAFEILGEHLKNPKVEGALLWNTRWVNNTTNQNDIFDALKSDGSLNPNGRALALWGNNLLNKMVAATGTTGVRVYASYNAANNQLNVFLVNKQTTAQPVNLTLSNYISNAVASRWELKGNGSPTDLTSSLVQGANVTAAGNTVALTVPAVSITLLKFQQPESPLPVELVHFSYLSHGSHIVLNWHTATETNNKSFTVQRSSNGVDFENVNTVAGGGTIDHPADYEYTDKSPLAGTSYYRLRQTDFDGQYTYSKVLAVTQASFESTWKVFPNPAKEEVNITFVPGEYELEVQVFTVEGKLYYENKMPAEEGLLKLDVGPWPKGVYFIRAKADEKSFTKKLVIE